MTDGHHYIPQVPLRIKHLWKGTAILIPISRLDPTSQDGCAVYEGSVSFSRGLWVNLRQQLPKSRRKEEQPRSSKSSIKAGPVACTESDKPFHPRITRA